MRRIARNLSLLIAIWMLIVMPASGQEVEAPEPAQVCDLKFQSSNGGCDNVSTTWFTKRKDALGVTLTYVNIFTGEQTVVSLPGSVTGYSLTHVGCEAHFNVTAVMTFSGIAPCTASLHDNHNRPCSECSTMAGKLSIGNAASFQPFLAPDAIGAAFGDQDFTTVTALSFDDNPNEPGIQLPTSLGGVSLFIDQRAVGLFFVSPKQINFYVPADMPLGPHFIYASTPDGRILQGEIYLNQNSPGIFTADSNGAGQAVGFWFLFRNGIPLRILTPGTLRPNDLQPGDRLFLILFGTGIRSANARLRLGNGMELSSLYAGDTPIFIGEDQVNFEVPINRVWTGSLGASLTVIDENGGSWPGNSFLLLGFLP